MRTITVLINDTASSNYNPMIYSVELESVVLAEDEIIEKVCIARLAEGCEDVRKSDIELLVAFEGNISPIADWRE